MSRKTAQQAIVVTIIAVAVTLGSSLQAQTAASTTSIGTGHASSAVAPQFLSTRPVIGSTVSMIGIHCPVDHVAYVLVGFHSLKPTQLPKGGFIYLDPSLLLMSGPLPITSAETFVSSVALPDEPGLEGVTIALQVLTLSTVDATEYALSNALEWTFGY